MKNRIKVLLVSATDITGGAAKAAYRLHKSLLDAGVDSQMLVQYKKSDDYTVESLANNKWQKGLNLLRPTIDQLPVKFYKNRTKTIFSPSWIGFNNVVNRINEINPDIVHLHWICGGMIRIEDLKKIQKPILWSLHDMWAFTGGCHYDEGCGGYLKECGSCKVLGSRNQKDLSAKVFYRKKKVFSAIEKISFVGLSRWMHRCAKSSTLLEEKEHIHLPNAIDTDVFKPFHKEKARELWNLPREKKLILFGAMAATVDPRKGFKALSEALSKLNDNDIEFVVFGSNEPQNKPDFKFKAHYVGHLHDDVSLLTLYSAVDVMVVPSLQENLSNAIMESLSCATPVVAFNVGGNGDMIEHQKNGYLARPFDTTDLANGIEWVLNAPIYDELCQNARGKILKEFDSRLVVQKYITLYKDILA